MHLLHCQGRRYAQFEHLRHERGLVHAFSTRPQNVSSGTGPHASAARKAMLQDLGLSADELRYCCQVHAPGLQVVDAGVSGGPLRACDGAATRVPGVPLMTFSADCPLVLVYDPSRPAVGLVHAGWRCTVARAAQRLAELMSAEFGCRPDRLLAGVGPGAGACCYEVRDDVYAAAAELPERERLFTRRDERLYFDLWAANHAQLIAAGVPAERIEVAGICTMCAGRELFHSYRRDGRRCGHFGLVAALAAR